MYKGLGFEPVVDKHGKLIKMLIRMDFTLIAYRLEADGFRSCRCTVRRYPCRRIRRRQNRFRIRPIALETCLDMIGSGWTRYFFSQLSIYNLDYSEVYDYLNLLITMNGIRGCNKTREKIIIQGKFELHVTTNRYLKTESKGPQ